MTRKKMLSLNVAQSLSGYLFLVPWLIGLILFFIYPFINTIYYSFNKMLFGQNGLTFNFTGLGNYKFLFFEDSNFLKLLIGSVQEIVLKTPVIVIFSLFMGLILSSKFKGQTISRVIFFIPVIISSGVIMSFMDSNVFAENSMSNGEGGIFQTGAINQILIDSGINMKITGYITGMVAKIFDISWSSGLQIVLFIGAIHTVPVSYYEAAYVEGANAWEKFWKITFPILIPFICLNVVYTVIDNFTSSQNAYMKLIDSRLKANDYGLASATSLVYFAIVLIFVLIIIKAFTTSIKRK